MSMEIYLTKDGKSIGPYSADALREKLGAGDVDADESAWAAEVGEWMRLEQVLERAPAPEGKGRSKRGGGRFGRRKKSQGPPPPPPDTLPAGKRRSSKLQSPAPDGLGISRGFDAAVQAMPTEDEKRAEAKRRGGARARRSNPVAFLRWLGLVAFVAVLFSIFLPWVRTTYGDSRTELSALQVVGAKAESFALPGTSEPVKYFGAAKAVLLASFVLAALVAFLSVLGARDREAEGSGLAMMLGMAAALGLVACGVIYGVSFERQFNAALADANQVLGGGSTIVFALGAGYYFALAGLVAMLACLAVPQIIYRSLREEMVPAGVILALACGIGFIGSRQLGAGSVGTAAESVGALFGEGVQVVKEKVGELGGGSKRQ